MASSLSCWLTSSPLTLASETLSGLPLAHFRVVSLFLRPSEALFFLVNPGSSPATTNVGRIYLRHSSNPHSMCITYTLSIYIYTYIYLSIYLSVYIYMCVCMYVITAKACDPRFVGPRLQMNIALLRQRAPSWLCFRPPGSLILSMLRGSWRSTCRLKIFWVLGAWNAGDVWNRPIYLYRWNQRFQRFSANKPIHWFQEPQGPQVP